MEKFISPSPYSSAFYVRRTNPSHFESRTLLPAELVGALPLLVHGPAATCGGLLASELQTSAADVLVSASCWIPSAICERRREIECVRRMHREVGPSSISVGELGLQVSKRSFQSKSYS